MFYAGVGIWLFGLLGNFVTIAKLNINAELLCLD